MESTQSGSLGEESCHTPRNAVAVVNLEKPQRSIKLRWEAPEMIPKYYEIEAIPETGKHKLRKCKTVTTIFPRLKTFTKYEFQISAVYDDERHSCLTNKIETHTMVKQSTPAHFQNLSGTNIDQSNSSITNTTQLLSARLDSYDKVVNMKMEMANEEGREMAWVTWNHPSFSGFYDDYEILQYRVEVFQLSTRVFHDFYKYETSPRTQKFRVQLGETYIVKIQTTYEELDSEKTLASSSETAFYSRPRYPMIKYEVDLDGNHLYVSWASSIGAEKFRAEISHKTTKTVIIMEEGGKDFRKMTLKIDKEVFRGVEYSVTVAGIGKHGGVSRSTKVIIIENQWAPRLARVSLNEEDPLHAVDVSWEKPERNPYKYVIISTADSSARLEVNDTRCTMRHLKTGTKYRFNIFAIYTDKLEHEYKCTTGEITTNPCLEQRVETLNVSPSDSSPESEISVNWEKVGNATEYRVSVTAGKFTIDYITDFNYYTAHGLEPNTEYSVAVSAGNDQGFGEELTESCKTAIKPPKEVSLSSSASDHVTVHWKGESTKHEVRLHNAKDETLVKKTNVEGFTSCEFKGLTGNTKYFVDIEPIGAGTSNTKRRSDAILTVPPVKIIKTLSNLKNKESLSTDVYMEWQKDQGSLAYDIEVKTEGNVENLLRVEDVNSHQYRCLKHGSLYDFRLRAVNSSGHGRWSTSKPIQLHNPGPPKYIKVTLDKEKPWEIANISWDRPDNIPLFKIQIRPQEVEDWVLRDNSYCFKLGKPLTMYEITIFSGHENEIFSSEPVKGTFTMGQMPTVGKETLLAVPNDDGTEVTLRWERPNGIESFRISWCGKCQNAVTTNDCTQTTANQVIIYSKELFNELEVKITSICGSDTGPCTMKTFLLRPMVSSTSYSTSRQGQFCIDVDVESRMEFDKTIIRADAKSGDNGNIMKEFQHPLCVRNNVTIDGLKPGEQYNLYVKVQQGNFCSHERHLNQYQVPYGKLENLRITGQSERSVTAEWDCPEIKPNRYLIWCSINPRCYDHLFPTRTIEESDTKIQITDLQPGYGYLLVVSPGSTTSIYNDASVVFRTAPRKMETPRMSRKISSKEVKIVWSRSQVADQYQVILHELGSEAQETKPALKYQTKETYFTLKELSRGLKYKVMVRGMNEAGSGEISDASKFSTEFNAPEIASRIRELSNPLLKLRLPSFVQPILITKGGRRSSLDDFVNKSSGITSVICGYPNSGLTSLCHYIANRFCDEKVAANEFSDKKLLVVFLLQGITNFSGTVQQLLVAHLWKTLKLRLSQIEICIFVEWMEENSDNIVFVIDNVAKSSLGTFEYAPSQTSMSHTAFIQQLLMRQNFTNSTVIATVPISSKHLIQELKPEKFAFLDSYDSNSMHNYVENYGKIAIGNWKIVESYSWSLCASARFCFTLANLRPKHKLNYSSPASVYLHVYRILYQEEKTKQILAQEIKNCTIVSKLHAIDSRSTLFEDLTAHEMFLLAMHAVFFFKKDFFQELIRTKRHFNFTLLCVGLLNPDHSELALSLLSPKLMENAASLCQRKHNSVSAVASLADKRIQAELGAHH